MSAADRHLLIMDANKIRRIPMSRNIMTMIVCAGLAAGLSGCAVDAAASPPVPAYAEAYPYAYPSDPFYYGDPAYGELGLDYGWYGGFGHRHFDHAHFDHHFAHAGLGGHGFGGHFGGGHFGGGHFGGGHGGGHR
jgi:hypothetical protein